MLVSKNTRLFLCTVIPVYCDLKVESIWSAGIERAAEVATPFTSSGSKVRISILMKWLQD
jgi:hypothetical protein